LNRIGPSLLRGSATVLAVGGVALYFFFAYGSTDDPIPPVETPPVETPPVKTEVVESEQPQDLIGYNSRLTDSGNPWVGTGQSGPLLRLLEDPPSQSHGLFVNARLAVAKDILRFGQTEEATRLLLEALEAEESYEHSHKPEILYELAVAYMKMGELDNCLSPTGALVCALPLDKSVVQQNTRGSSNAIKHLLRFLEMKPDSIKARWLLNIAHMTMGSYPEGVPQDYLVSVDVGGKDPGIGRFEDIAHAVGLYTLNLAGGSIIEDFDNDGLLDIMTSTWDPGGPMIYYHNDGNGLFSDFTSRAGLDGQLGGLNIVQTDYNDDGWMDVLVMRGGWLGDAGQMRVSLLRNNGDGTFSDVTHEAGLARPAYPSQSASWADYDSDGDLDLISCNESTTGSFFDREGGTKYPSQLFRNNGDGTFTDVASEAGVTNLRYCKGSAWGDFDNDGDPDLYLSNFTGENRLYRNNGDGTFTDVAPELGVTEPIGSFATWFWDYNNDGWLDLFVAGYGTDIEDVAADYLGLPNDGARPRLYLNDGAGGFVDVTREAGLYRVHLTMAANFGDLDNDGFLDFYLGTGETSYDAIGPNIMYRNMEGKGFVDVTFAGGFGHLQKGHGIAFGDLDRDGDQDIFQQLGGFYPGDRFSNALYENPGHGNRWLSVRLVGRKTNRAAIGARIKVVVLGAEGIRDVYAHVSSGGSFGASSLEQELGLGRARRIESLEVYWPTSDTVQVFRDVPLDTYIEIREGDKAFTVRDLPRISFKP